MAVTYCTGELPFYMLMSFGSAPRALHCRDPMYHMLKRGQLTKDHLENSSKFWSQAKINSKGVLHSMLISTAIRGDKTSLPGGTRMRGTETNPGVTPSLGGTPASRASDPHACTASASSIGSAQRSCKEHELL